MKRLYRWSVITTIAVSGGMLSSCTTGLLMPTRDAAVQGLADFVSQTVFTLLDGLVNAGASPL